ncbi:TPA: DNA gyrase subunit A [Candidatus Poribacteria bacterium]|nr:DNA gyrase subunit A [Candidatus Poribacteria bacterium]
MLPIGEKIIPRDIEDELKESYLNYSMSVIVNRALPDVRDGLKPSIRRILYAMYREGFTHDKPTVKCARIVGEVMGKYHPHGDDPIYGTLVRMAQDFSMRYMLVDGQGNFGSIDDDPPGAMRYTEARMSAIAEEMMVDINKDAVDFRPNFDESLQEPVVLPAKLPNLLVNGTSGIAVAMATNIPPHNICEVVDGIIMLIENPDVTIEELMTVITGPDFPTGGLILGREGIRNAYLYGRGSIIMRARAVIEKSKSGKESIVITEIPYQVNKTTLKERIANLVRSKVINGISDLRDESDKDGIRVVIELKKDEIAQVVLNQLYKHTSMQTTFGANMLALVDNQPKVLNLKQILNYYIKHRREVILRRTRFDLNRALRRAHILEGLKIALANLDAVVATIRASANPAEARDKLMSGFKLSQAQVQAILEMTLQRLTGLERRKVDEEYAELLINIQELRSILASDALVKNIIKQELLELKEKYGDDRRTEIVEDEGEFSVEDLIAEEDMVVTISHAGYIKRMPLTAYRKQHRGGVGVKGMGMKDEDFLEHIFIASTHHYILFFTDKGKCYWLKVFEIPEEGRLARGKAIVNLIQVEPGEKIASFVPVKDFDDKHYVFMVTRNGTVKKTNLTAFSQPSKRGIIAVKLDEGDNLVDVRLTDGDQDVILVTHNGMSIRFPETDVRVTARNTIGVRGIRLEDDDHVVGMSVADDNATLLVVTEKGFGKRTDMSEYRRQSRGGKGIIAIKTSLRNGPVVGIKSVTDKDELIIMTTAGMIIRLPISGVRTIGRNTQGVRLIALQDDDLVSDIARVAVSEEEANEKKNKESLDSNDLLNGNSDQPN